MSERIGKRQGYRVQRAAKLKWLASLCVNGVKVKVQHQQAQP
jgi:hypothetical protein